MEVSPVPVIEEEPGMTGGCEGGIQQLALSP